MSNAVFNSNVTYTPGGGGTLTQSFAVTVSYAAISAGTIDIPASAAVGPATFTVPFGAVSGANGLLVKNNTANPLGIRLNGSSGDIYQIAPNGVLMHWAPKPGVAVTTPLTAAVVTIGITDGGSVDYVVLGD